MKSKTFRSSPPNAGCINGKRRKRAFHWCLNRRRRPIFDLKRALWVNWSWRKLEKRPQIGKKKFNANITFFIKRWRRIDWASLNGDQPRRKTRRRALIWYIKRLLTMNIHYFIASTTKLVIFVAHIWAYSSIPVNITLATYIHCSLWPTWW